MAGEYCTLPSAKGDPEAEAIDRMLSAKRIAVVGLSDDHSRPSYGVSSYMRSAGKEILPVNPSHETAMGLKCYPSLEAVPGPVEVVNVFRRPRACADVVRSAIAIGAKGVWLQSGIRNDEAKRLAEEAGLDFVQDRCIMVEHRFHRR